MSTLPINELHIRSLKMS